MIVFRSIQQLARNRGARLDFLAALGAIPVRFVLFEAVPVGDRVCQPNPIGTV